MRAEINEVAGRVHSLDAESLLEPRTLQRIVLAVLQALEDREQHDKRAAAERGVQRGVAWEQERED